MTSIHEIFTTFGPEYLQRYATKMPKATVGTRLLYFCFSLKAM
jgi:hypothetical protein